MLFTANTGSDFTGFFSKLKKTSLHRYTKSNLQKRKFNMFKESFRTARFYSNYTIMLKNSPCLFLILCTLLLNQQKSTSVGCQPPPCQPYVLHNVSWREGTGLEDVPLQGVPEDPSGTNLNVSRGGPCISHARDGQTQPKTLPSCYFVGGWYRSGTVNSKSFVGKVLLQIKWEFELINAL